MSYLCNNEHIMNFFFFQENENLYDINWKTTWLLRHKFAISNNIQQEVQYKIIHNIYPNNIFLSKFVNIDVNFVFCNTETETIKHLFFFEYHALMLALSVSADQDPFHHSYLQPQNNLNCM